MLNNLNHCRGVITAMLLIACTVGALNAGTIVVGDDINTFSSSIAGSNEQTFAVNVASLLTAGDPTKNLLLIQSGTDSTRNFAPGVISALTAAGFNVTVTSNESTSLTGYNAVFVGQSYPTVGFVNNTSLINFANGGGGVYIVGGVGPDAANEAAGWSTFLNNYGLGLAAAYNGFTNIPTTGTNAIFNGVSSINVGNGQSIIDLGTNPNAQVVETYKGQNVFAIVNVSSTQPTPEPGTIGLLFTAFAALGVARGARRFRNTQ